MSKLIPRGNCSMFVFIVTVLFSVPSYGFLDFLGEQTKKAAETAAYADAVAELAGELSPDSEVSAGAKDIQKRSDRLRSESSNLYYLSQSTKNVLSGPNWSSKRLESNIRNTTDYVRRVKRLIARIAILGTDGATALNTTETNVALNEVQKNQQAMLLQNEDAKLRQIEKEQEESKQWEEFSDRQRRQRKKEVVHGQL